MEWTLDLHTIAGTWSVTHVKLLEAQLTYIEWLYMKSTAICEW